MSHGPWPDDALPDWAHTTLVMLIAGAFALPWLWHGTAALLTGELSPLMGPQFGSWLFGGRSLADGAARKAGLALFGLGLVFLAWGLACTRWADCRPGWRRLPWVLLTLDLLLYWWAIPEA